MINTSIGQAQKIYTGKEVFAPVLKALSPSTIPLRLPNYIAAETSSSPHKFFSKIDKVTSTEYIVHIVTRPDCTGETFCLDGIVTGKKNKSAMSIPNSENANLVNGIKGRFVKYTCGASCSMSEMHWKEGNYQYSVQIKAAPKSYMIDIANSAITDNVARE